jgi:fructose-1,6-bisphosphatase II
MEKHLSRNMGMDLIRATEAAAANSGRWMGLGNPMEADLAATQALLEVLNTIDIDGTVVIGEEKPDQDSIIKSDMKVGSGDGPQVDIVIDPVDGRLQLAQGHPGAISVVAVAPAGTMRSPAPARYMYKIVANAEVGPSLVAECIDAPAAWTLALVARAKGKKVKNLIVTVLDRPRHRDLIEEIRTAGARVILRSDGDIAGALLACVPDSDVDVLMGIGGTLEGLIVACAVKALGGGMLARIEPQSDEERNAVKEAGINTELIFSCSDLVDSNEVFFTATGITEGPLLSGITYRGNRANTNSMILRGITKTRRIIHAEHVLDY